MKNTEERISICVMLAIRNHATLQIQDTPVNVVTGSQDMKQMHIPWQRRRKKVLAEHGMMVIVHSQPANSYMLKFVLFKVNADIDLQVVNFSTSKVNIRKILF